MRGLETIVAVGLLIAAGGPALSATQQDYNDCAQTSNPALSLAACTRLIQDPAQSVSDRVIAYLNRGNDNAALNQPDSAIADYSEAIKLDPRNIVALSSRAIAYFGKGDRERAIADYNAANTLDPKQVTQMAAGSAELKEIASAAGPSVAAPAPSSANSPNAADAGCSDALCGTTWRFYYTFAGENHVSMNVDVTFLPNHQLKQSDRFGWHGEGSYNVTANAIKVLLSDKPLQGTIREQRLSGTGDGLTWYARRLKQ
jgi:tetratricopeptide (TPR) repeat protein